MKTDIRYIEQKTGYGDNGPAWIVKVGYSKTGETVYGLGKAFQRSRGADYNFVDVETGEGYWISGVKKTGVTVTGRGTEKSHCKKVSWKNI